MRKCACLDMDPLAQAPLPTEPWRRWPRLPTSETCSSRTHTTCPGIRHTSDTSPALHEIAEPHRPFFYTHSDNKKQLPSVLSRDIKTKTKCARKVCVTLLRTSSRSSWWHMKSTTFQLHFEFNKLTFQNCTCFHYIYNNYLLCL